MPGASRYKSDRHVAPADAATGNVLRPSFKRWLPGWVVKSAQTGITNDCEVVALTVEVDAVDLQQQIENRRKSLQLLQSNQTNLTLSLDDWCDKARLAGNRVTRVNSLRDAALERLTAAGEIPPQKNCRKLTVLQQSYQNFDRQVQMVRKKEVFVQQQLASVEQQHRHTAELIVSQTIQLEALQSHFDSDDGFKQAA